MESEVKLLKKGNGRIQRVQIVRFDSFKQLSFMNSSYHQDAFERIYHLYNDFIVPRMPFAFGQILLFCCPEDYEIKNEILKDYQKIACDKTTILKMAFHDHLKIVKGKAIFDDDKFAKMYYQLYEKGKAKIVCGKLPFTVILPVSNRSGFISELANENNVVVNSSFFVMDVFDNESNYDIIDSPLGLMLKDGRILNPPLFNRETLLVKKDGQIEIKHIDLKQLEIVVNGQSYIDGNNMKLYQRPHNRYSKHGGWDIIVVNNYVCGIKNGSSIIPSGGFIMHFDKLPQIMLGQEIKYRGLEEYDFAIQVGNSVVINGQMSKKFNSYFSNIYNPFSINCPPSLYPLNFDKDVAPRMVLAADIDNKPMLLWFEGEGKFTNDKNNESEGVSLLECAQLCQQLGAYNGIHLDGGGSAQIIYKGERMLRLSDRNKEDYSQVERAIPCGLVVEE